MSEKVSITKEEYDKLLKDRITLESLQEAGVDNWEGYSMAMEIKTMKELFPKND